MISAITESWTELWNWPIKTESYVKHGKLLQYSLVLDQNSGVFLRNRNIFVLGEHSWEFANAWDQLCLTSEAVTHLPKQFKLVPGVIREVGDVQKLQNSLLTPKYRIE